MGGGPGRDSAGERESSMGSGEFGATARLRGTRREPGGDGRLELRVRLAPRLLRGGGDADGARQLLWAVQARASAAAGRLRPVERLEARVGARLLPLRAARTSPRARSLRGC